MNKQRWYCYFLILIMVLSVVSSVYVQHPNIRADANPPTVTINFAGNLTDSGGPYWRPPGESDILDEAGEGVFRDGYYTNDSRQSEGWIYINLTVVDTDGVDNVWLNWLNESTWTNYTYQFTNEPGDWWTINTSNNFSTVEGYNYSFDIVANDTVPNSITVEWNKTGIGGNYARRYVQLNCTPINISYTPFYFYEVEAYTGANKQDRLHRDQGSDGGSADTGYLETDIPTDTVVEVDCGGFVGYWFNGDMCVEEFMLENIYYRYWYNYTWIPPDSETGWDKTRGANDIAGDEVYTNLTPRSNVTYDYGGGGNLIFHLESTLFDITDTNFTDNNIYELLLTFTPGNNPKIINNRSFNSFALFNVPSNTTLNASYPDSDSDSLSDWNELYVTYTNPFLADTDNDGIDDYWENQVGTDPNNYTDWNESTLPIVTTNTTTGIGQQNATLHGYLDDDGNDTCRVGFQWGTTTSYGHTDFDLPLISGQNPPSNYNPNNIFKFPKDIWLYNSSVEADGSCDNFFTQGGIFSTLGATFRYINGVLDDSYIPNRPFVNFPFMDNSTDQSTYTYYLSMDNADVLEFTYDNLTATTNDEFGHQIGIIGGLHLYGLQPGTQYHYRAFATNDNGTVYGSDMTFTTLHNWTTTLNCYNASDGSPITDWDIFVTNQSGSHTYTNLSVNNPHSINLSDGSCPTGTNIAFMFSKDGYTNRTYYYDISVTGNYTIDAYLNFYNGSNLYLLSVVDEIDQPVPDAKMAIKEYINETLGYLNVTIVYTDGNGQVAVYLTPETLYKVIITKDGYQTEEADFEPSSLIYTYTFRLEYGEIEPKPPETPVEEITFNGYISGNTLYVNYTDNMEQTINSLICIYEINHLTNTTSLLTSDSRIGDNDFQISATINTSFDHLVILHYNHTEFGYQHITLIFPKAFTPYTTETDVNLLFETNYGTSPGGMGWSNFIMWGFLLAGCIYADNRDAGVIMILIGGLFLFINAFIGFNNTIATFAGGMIPVLFIVVGILIMWNDSRKKMVGG